MDTTRFFYPGAHREMFNEIKREAVTRGGGAGLVAA